MPFTVVWRKVADDRFAALWLQAADRAAVTAAANSINSRLRLDPFNCGQKHSELLYQWIEPPLVVLFSISADDRLVTVRDVDIVA